MDLHFDPEGSILPPGSEPLVNKLALDDGREYEEVSDLMNWDKEKSYLSAIADGHLLMDNDRNFQADFQRVPEHVRAAIKHVLEHFSTVEEDE